MTYDDKCPYCRGYGEIVHGGLIDMKTGDEVVSTCWYCEGRGYR